jgi:predicted RNA-binding Zn ribbon-like protein
MSGMSTELVGNALCLDFANSVNQRADPRHDWLAEPDGLRRWAVVAGLPRPSIRPADSTLSAALVLREAIYRAFSAVAGGRRPAPADLATISATAAEGLAAAALVGNHPSAAADNASGTRDGGKRGARDGGKPGARDGDQSAARDGAGWTDASRGGTAYRLEWRRTGDPRRVLWAVADSAVELLRHGPLDRVGECPSCGWVFLDTSRNGRRRWCSMAMCGNAVKSARHYAKTTRR